MRFATLLACLLAVPAAAQAPGTYAVFATQAELDDGGTLSGAVPTCLLAGTAAGISGAFFWDATSEQFAIYDASADPGSRTNVPVAAFLIDFAAGTDVETCRDATPELDASGVPTGVAFLVLSNGSDQDFVARVDAANQGFSILTDRGNATDSGDGISGIAQVGDVLYLARQQAFGAPEDGIYTIDTSAEGQVPTALLTDADLDLTAIASYSDLGGAPDEAELWAVSSEFGTGGYTNVLLRVDLEVPELQVAFEPCAGASPLFTNCDDGGLEDLALGAYAEGDVVTVSAIVTNNSFSGPEGETVGVFDIAGFYDPFVRFTEAGLVAATGVSGFTPSAPSGYLSVLPLDFSGSTPVTFFLASSDAFGAEAGIYAYSPPFGTGAEANPEAAFRLSASPNPTTGAARLAVTPERAGALRVSVVDALGRTVAVLHDGAAAAGSALELATPELAPGVYTVRVESAAGVATERFTVAR